MINNTDSLYPFVVPVQYPKVGEDPSRVRVAVVNASNGHRTWMNIPGDQIQNYIPRMQWVGDKLLVQQLNRHQNNLKFWSCDVATGKARLIHEETDAAYIEVMNNDFSTTRGATDDLELLVKSKELVHLSEKDGWKHLHAIKVDGSGSRCITNVEYDVASVYSVLVDKDLTYFSASPGNATQRYLYSSSLSGKGKAQRLTPKEFSGVNHYSISPNGKYAIHSHSSMTAPRSVRLISLPSHKVIRVLANNEALKSKVDSLGYRLPEMIKITTEDGIDLDVRILKPANFDPAKKYPVIFYVYGEPWGQTCTDGWSFGYDNVLAEMGYVVMTMDNRGTPCPRGREWRKSCYRQLGRINIRDQAMGAKELLKLPYVDAERIGVWGWSGGGSSTLNLMFQYPEIYSCGIAVAPVANQLYYDNIYQERYMGLPQENEEDFLAGSPVSYAQNLEGDLLVIHGTGDDNVHYQGTELLINELIKHNKIFYMMAYPNRSHGIYEGEGTTKHLYNTMMTFLQDHLEPGGK
jgi:dipeptidyl-peptidase 4